MNLENINTFRRGMKSQMATANIAIAWSNTMTCADCHVKAKVKVEQTRPIKCTRCQGQKRHYKNNF